MKPPPSKAQGRIREEMKQARRLMKNITEILFLQSYTGGRNNYWYLEMTS